MDLKYSTVSSLQELFQSDIDSALEYSLDKSLLDGVIIGFLINGNCYLRIVGNVTLASTFELGSITKLYTVELLNILVDRKAMKWDDPITKYLPSLIKRKNLSKGEESPSLIDIARHFSGLPIFPSNLKVIDGSNPFNDYSRKDLEDYIENRSWTTPEETRYNYSNLGYALLGYAIEEATLMTFDEVFTQEVLIRLGLNSSYLAMSEKELPSLVQGHSKGGNDVPRWTQKAMAPAGALCSTAMDQLKSLKFFIENESKTSEDLCSPISLGWNIERLDNWLVRDGLTGGFCSHLAIHAASRCGLVLLANTACRDLLSVLAENCQKALLGLPTLPIKGDYGRKAAIYFEFLQRVKRRVYLLDRTWRFAKYNAFR